MNQPNPFTLSFGKEPKEYIRRTAEYHEIIGDFEKENPASCVYIITGVRGSGKTVLLSSLYKYFDEAEKCIAVDLNTNTNMLEDLAAALYDKAPIKHRFLKGEFSFSFSGLSISLKGENPVTSISQLLEKMLTALKAKGMKVIVTVDDVDTGTQMKAFVKEFQSLFRKDLPILLVVTGLFSTVGTLEKQEGLTFLQRGKRLYLGPLNIRYIASSYKDIFRLDDGKALQLALLTKGYAFGYQALGYLLFEKGASQVDEDILRNYDYYLEEYVYRRVYNDLPEKEKAILRAMAFQGITTNKGLVEARVITNNEIKRYKDKLTKKGICATPNRGEIVIILPRFAEYIRFVESVY
ncbi:MAG: hypothetical protein IJU64_03500 [Bacilli bacterium]|nr:hypothetical protein [Bacilli bacterium]